MAEKRGWHGKRQEYTAVEASLSLRSNVQQIHVALMKERFSVDVC